MIEIIGEYNKAVIYADSMDSGAEGLIRALCNSPSSRGSRIRIMPDVHAGKGCAVGTTMTVTDRIMPGLVGGDIGCGMSVFKVSGKRMEMQKLDKLVHEKIPAGMKIRGRAHRFSEETEVENLLCARHVRKDKAMLSVGTLGGGNHFIEMDKDGEGGFWLVVHSGSRHLGQEVNGYYQDEAFHSSQEGTPYELSYLTGSLMDDYLHDMAITQDYAEVNRRAIADEIIRGMKLDVEDTFSTVHNYIDPETMVLRKGAVSAKAGERLIIPLNMRDGSLICRGKGNDGWNCSAPHGAGRALSRQEAVQSVTLSQFRKEMKGIYSSTVTRETLDESPSAYKPMEEIVNQICDTVDILEAIKPVYNFKAGREDR